MYIIISYVNRPTTFAKAKGRDTSQEKSMPNREHAVLSIVMVIGCRYTFTLSNGYGQSRDGNNHSSNSPYLPKKGIKLWAKV